MPDLEQIKRLSAWLARLHERCHERPAGTYGPDDRGVHATCVCSMYLPHTWEKLRHNAGRVHRKYEHPGPPDDCQSPHDVLCKVVWP